MEHTHITIVTICYNSEKTIEKTILSVLHQNYEQLQYVIVDGGSTDNTLKIIKKYADSRFRIISEPDHGISDAFNKGIRLADGELIGLINSDDRLCKGALQAIDAAYRSSPADVIYGDTIVIDPDNGLTMLKKAGTADGLKYEMPFIHQSCFIRKQAYQKCGEYSDQYKICMDYDMLARMYHNGCTFSYINKTLSVFQYGGTSCRHPLRTIHEDLKIAKSYGLKDGAAFRYGLKSYTRNIIKILLQKMGIWKYLYRTVRQRNTAINIEDF